MRKYRRVQLLAVMKRVLRDPFLVFRGARRDWSHDRARDRHHHARRGDEDVRLPPRARRPEPGRAVPDGRAEHPSRAQGHGDAPRLGRVLRDAAVPVLPRRPVPRVRHQRRGHARPGGHDAHDRPHEDRRRRPRPARCRRRRSRRPPGSRRRRGLLHERRPWRSPSPRRCPTASPPRRRSTVPGW